MLLSNEDHAKIATFVPAFGGPQAVSLSEETHLFHFDKSDWRKSPVVLVNKNGNHMRMVRCFGVYHLFKTWNMLDGDTNDWTYVQQKDSDPEKLLAKVTVGPGTGKREFLSLLPKEATPARQRKAVWRWGMFDVRFNMTAGTFTLCCGDKWSDPFPGKPWESVIAGMWCADQIKHLYPPLETPVGFVENPYQREAMMAEAMVDLEDNPLWGAF